MKKWLYGIISLIMLGSGIAVAMPNDFSMPCEDGNVEVTAPKQETPNQDNSNSQNDNSNSDNNSNSDDNSGNNSSDEPSQEPEESEEITTYEFRSYLDYFIDNDIVKDTMTEEDYTGSGTEEDPYIINSTRGFWYLGRYSPSRKHYELNCDVYLNDETFDENGKPHGGDGVVYEWNMFTGPINSFDGNEHTVYGLYHNNPNTSRFGLFGQVEEDMENLKMNNFYINAGNNVGAIAYIVHRNLINCETFNGTIKAKERVGGLVNGFNRGYVKDCVNRTNIEAGYIAGGISSNMPDKISECKNYGKIFTRGGWVGGIIPHTAKTYVHIENCENYGEIFGGTGQHTGGVLGTYYHVEDGKVYLKNCKNYGYVHSNAGTQVGGMIASFEGYATLVNCENYGKIANLDPKTAGNFVGLIYNENNKSRSVVDIQGGYSKHGTNACILGIIHHSSLLEIHSMRIDLTEEGSDAILVRRIASDSDVYVENVEINTRNNVKNLSLFGHCDNYTNEVTVKNVLVNLNHDINLTKPIFSLNLSGVNNFDGVVFFDNLKQGRGLYYGEDFSDYYLDYKTGKIGIRKLDNVGDFKGSISKEWLKDYKGYKLITI